MKLEVNLLFKIREIPHIILISIELQQVNCKFQHKILKIALITNIHLKA